MSLAEIQREVDRYIAPLADGYWPPLANLARLAEEVGEVARELNDRFGPKAKKPGEAEGSLALELADVVFVVCCLANQLGIDLDEAFRASLEKYRTRDAGRWRRLAETDPAAGPGGGGPSGVAP